MPGNCYAREQGFSRTRAQLVEFKMALVGICRRRERQRVPYPANFRERFRADCRSIELRVHLRCSICLGRMANLHEAAC
jgi:hypothetical protein